MNFVCGRGNRVGIVLASSIAKPGDCREETLTETLASIFSLLDSLLANRNLDRLQDFHVAST